MAKLEKRFTILLEEEEWKLINHHAKVRGLKTSEFIRIAIRHELTGKSTIDRINALRNLYRLKQDVKYTQTIQQHSRIKK